MSIKRNKFTNFEYSDEIKKLLNCNLTQKDIKKLSKIYDNYSKLELSRTYEPIIKDIYILIDKHNLTTKELSAIYNTGIRNIQIWLKELGLNRSIKKAKKINKKSSVRKHSITNLSETISTTESKTTNKFGIEIYKEDDLPPSLRDFLSYLETIKGKSNNTIDGYKIDLTLFFRFLKIYKGLPIDDSLEFQEIPINDITNDFIKLIKLSDMYAFLSFVEKQRNNSAYARARKVASLKSFFKYLYEKAKIITFNPTLELESPKINQRHPVYLTLNQSLHVLNSLDKNHKNYERDYCILTFFLNCGMRLSELCSISLDKIKGDTLSIIGKGNKERTIYLNEACLKTLNAYLKVRDASRVSENDKQYLFLSSRNKPINKRTVELLVKKHIQNAGFVDAKYTPHKLRHTAATLMYKHGNVDIRSLQNILGHESISTTQIYTHVDEEQLREAVNSNPLSKI